MSIRIMALTYQAHFHDIEFMHVGKNRKTNAEYTKTVKVMNFNLKSVCLALADHANDEGEGAYPAIETIASKTEISDVTVVACLKAMRQEKIIFYTGRSKWDTCNYTINKMKLAEMATWERQKREKPKSKAASIPDKSKAASILEVKPLHRKSKATLHKPSLTTHKPSYNNNDKTYSNLDSKIERILKSNATRRTN
jgi:mRNA deadenylase 3'-5' endonuclease subunit Ccr4